LSIYVIVQNSNRIKNRWNTKEEGGKNMNKDQKINCTVGSCAFHNEREQKCSLTEIVVEACPGCNNGKPSDESMCGSYENKTRT